MKFCDQMSTMTMKMLNLFPVQQANNTCTLQSASLESETNPGALKPHHNPIGCSTMQETSSC